MSRQAHITLVNGIETSALDISDRGLAYGDGLFETMRVVKGKIPLFPHHKKRFEQGVRVLRLGDPEELGRQFALSVEEAIRSVYNDAVLKMMVTRGKGARGYPPPALPECNFIAQVFEPMSNDSAKRRNGITIRMLNYTLGHNPVLAGIKHLNRLDQVLASAELDGDPEGLVRDYQGDLIEGTKSNVLLFFSDRVVTPDLSQCGVEGTLRQFLIEAASETGLDIEVERVPSNALGEVAGIAMINSVFGCWPVRKLDDRKLKIDKRCRRIQAYLHEQLGFPDSV